MSRWLPLAVLMGCPGREPDVFDDRWCPTEYDEVLEQYADAMCRWGIRCDGLDPVEYDNCVASYYMFADNNERFCFEGCNMRTCLRAYLPEDATTCDLVRECDDVFYNEPCLEDACAACTE